MDLLTLDELKALVRQDIAACASIFLPTHRAGPETRQDPIRFKNLLREAEEGLRAMELRSPQVRELLKPARRLLTDSAFWRHQSDGLAVFAGVDLFRYHRLPLDFTELVVVGKRCHIKPLLPLFMGDGHFFILALSQNQIRLLEGTRHRVDEIDNVHPAVDHLRYAFPHPDPMGQPQRIVLPIAIFGAALLLSAVGVIPVQIALVAAVVISITGKFVSLREAYDSIDWPIIVLLGAMIPVGEALETTGAAQLVANGLLHIGGQLSAMTILATVLVVTMFLSDLVNNAAAVVLTAPIGISVAQGLGASADPFLMAIAIGASCAFLTPIGHQSNTLVMGPGGYKFGDYWRMGLLLEVVVVLVGVPLIRLVWPL